MIENPAYVSIRNSQLVIRTDAEHSVADGYHMLQYSVYARVYNGMDAVEKHRMRIKNNLPDNGTIRMLVITEKQYESIDILLGRLTEADEPFQSEQLSFF